MPFSEPRKQLSGSDPGSSWRTVTNAWNGRYPWRRQAALILMSSNKWSDKSWIRSPRTAAVQTFRQEIGRCLCVRLREGDARKPDIFPALNFGFITTFLRGDGCFFAKGSVLDGLAVDGGVDAAVVFLDDADQYSASRAKEAVGYPAALTTSDQMGFVLDPDTQFSAWIGYV